MNKKTENDDFLSYVKQERKNIIEALHSNWLNLIPKERVAVENLLIAYDQMVDKLSSQFTTSIDEKEIERLARKHANITHNRPLDSEERYYKDYQKYDGLVEGIKLGLYLSLQKTEEKKEVEFTVESVAFTAEDNDAILKLRAKYSYYKIENKVKSGDAVLVQFNF